MSGGSAKRTSTMSDKESGVGSQQGAKEAGGIDNNSGSMPHRHHDETSDESGVFSHDSSLIVIEDSQGQYFDDITRPAIIHCESAGPSRTPLKSHSKRQRTPRSDAKRRQAKKLRKFASTPSPNIPSPSKPFIQLSPIHPISLSNVVSPSRPRNSDIKTTLERIKNKNFDKYEILAEERGSTKLQFIIRAILEEDFSSLTQNLKVSSELDKDRTSSTYWCGEPHAEPYLQSFENLDKLIQHLVDIHFNKIKIFTCDHCNKAWIRKDAYLKHPDKCPKRPQPADHGPRNSTPIFRSKAKRWLGLHLFILIFFDKWSSLLLILSSFVLTSPWISNS